MDIKNMDVRLICAGFALLGIFVLPNLASAGLAMFWDDFEQDKLGGQPSQWKYAAGNQKGEIIKDPKDGSNQVFSMPDRFPRGSFGFYVIGDKTWTDYVVEWDWMPAAGYHGINFRYNDKDNYYLADKRDVTGEIKFYKRQAGWQNFATGSFKWNEGDWYRARLILKGSKFTVKIKEKGDKTSFKQIDPEKSGVEGEDKNFKSGGFCSGKGLIDNVVVGKTINDLDLTVDGMGKLATIWGRIKT
ncbi:MAG: hypothetical protein VCF25_31915 [Candidatus Poribacteria bacterium]|nr:hypothetical protein [Candidatus Poribacteria bacterium]HIO50287.1 hypothetical protein [Candidatus Poribacteria bacterium]HIO81347.1 hypothetical protein [Candidatus Poribacteria bacterium]